MDVVDSLNRLAKHICSRSNTNRGVAVAKNSRSAKVVSLRSPTAAATAAPSRLGTLTGVDKDGQLVVDYPGNPLGPIPAISLIRLTTDEASALTKARHPVLLTFEGGRPERPVVLGLVQHPAVGPAQGREEAADKELRAIVDGQEVLLKGSERVELRCGKASIVLTKAGKVIIRGEYISSSSTGVHRIRGGSVSLN